MPFLALYFSGKFSASVAPGGRIVQCFSIEKAVHMFIRSAGPARLTAEAEAEVTLTTAELEAGSNFSKLESADEVVANPTAVGRQTFQIKHFH